MNTNNMTTLNQDNTPEEYAALLKGRLRHGHHRQQ